MMVGVALSQERHCHNIYPDGIYDTHLSCVVYCACHAQSRLTIYTQTRHDLLHLVIHCTVMKARVLYTELLHVWPVSVYVLYQASCRC